MTLVPRLPPGRANRKALQYATEIQRLRRDGYTFAAIHLALLDAGVHVSLSTVKREGTRRVALAVGAQQAVMTDRPAATAHPSAVTAPTAHLQVPLNATGREIAEAFFTANPSNPLLSTKELP